MMSTDSGRALALVRMSVGLYFLLSAWKKTANHWFADGSPVAEFIQKNLPAAEVFYRPFLERTALPNADLFADLVTLGEWTVGITLLLGLLTRIGALSAILLIVNFALAKGLSAQVAAPIVSTDWVFVVASIACIIGRAGLVWGLDGRFRHTLAANPITRWLAGIPSKPTVTITLPATGRLGRVLHFHAPRRRAS